MYQDFQVIIKLIQLQFHKDLQRKYNLRNKNNLSHRNSNNLNNNQNKQNKKKLKKMMDGLKLDNLKVNNLKPKKENDICYILNNNNIIKLQIKILVLYTLKKLII